MSSNAVPPSPRAYSLTQDQLNRTKYFGRDFFTFYDDMIFRIQSVFFSTFSNFINSDPAMMLVDITCWAMDLLSFYIDRRATEAYLTTARTRKAVSVQARTLGYKMYGAVPATVDLQVTLDETYAFVVTYPAGFQWVDVSGNTWESLSDLTFLPGEVGPKTTTIREGETKTENFVSDGSINQRFELAIPTGRAISWQSDAVWVGATQWDRYDFLPYEAVNGYEVAYNDSPPKVVFGDDITGNIPVLSANITVKYVSTLGAKGRILAERMQDVAEPLVIAGTTIQQTIINPDPSSGGDDAEPIARTQALAPQVYRARDVNITKADYVARATGYASSAYGVVTMAQAFSTRSAASDIELQTCMNMIRNGLVYYGTLLIQQTALGLNDLDHVLDSTGSTGSNARAYSSFSDLLLVVNQIDSLLDDVTSEITTILGATSTQESLLTNLEALLVSLVGSGDLTAVPGKSSIDPYIAQLRTQKTNIENSSSTINAKVADSKEKVILAQGEVATGQTELTDSAAEIQNVRGHLQLSATYLASLGTDVNDALACIEAHVDNILSDDCKANLVTVPILSTDANGFYTAPTMSLIAAVESYLEARKEVTQTVEVVDGSFYLVAAEITINLGVIRGYIGEEIVAIVDRNVRSILKKRSFGLNLYKSEIHDECDGVDGVDFSNITITGPTTHVDANGNLVIDETETITLGTLTIDYEISNPPE
jgi:hypothetical protein